MLLTLSVFALCLTVFSNRSHTSELPVGTILPFVGQTAPEGFLLCDGRLLSGADAQYKELFNLIATTFGPEIDAEDNPVMTSEEQRRFNSSSDYHFLFRLPDLRDRFIQGKGNETIGHKDGTAEHTLTIEEMPSHKHKYQDIYFSEMAHYGPSVPIVELPNGLGSGKSDYDNVGHQMERDEGEVAGGSKPHNNLPPYLVLNYIIKY